MTKLHSFLAVVMLTLAAAQTETSWGRGFGGMHAGGMHGGGMGGMGGMRPGGMGGMRPGGTGGMGMRPGGLSPGGGIGNIANQRPDFGGAGRGGFSPGGGFGNVANQRPDFAGAGRAGETGLGQRGFPGEAAGGFGANRSGQRAAGDGSGPFGDRSADRPDRGQLSKFLGLPSDGGLHNFAGNQIRGDQRGLSRFPDADLQRRGDDVRRDFRGRDFYNADWYRRHPGAWYPRRWAYGNVWTAATWASLGSWFGYGDADYDYYDYGNNVTYQDNSVYMNGQDMGTADQYYQQAQNLASTGTEAQTTDDTQWLPLGVFAMTHDKQTNANLILQLAVNKEGIIRGNYTATLTNDTKPVQGSVDKKTQRAAWTIGDNTQNVIETGIYNLTKDEAPILVHFGKDKTEQWLLVRVKQDEQPQQPSSSE
jgi:hypothetical protein